MANPTILDSVVDEFGEFGLGLFSNMVPAEENTEYEVVAFIVVAGVFYYGNMVEVTTIKLEKLMITPILPVVNIGDTVQFTVWGYYSDGTIVNVTSICSYLEIDYALFIPVFEEEGMFTVVPTTGSGVVATVNSVGLATGVSGGLAKIKIEIAGLIEYAVMGVQPVNGTVDIGGAWNGELAPGTVVPNLLSLGLVISSPMLVGTSQQAQVIAHYDNGTQGILFPSEVTWTSSDTTVATVDTDGLIVTIKVGLTFIRVTYKVLTSPETEFTTILMLRVENVEETGIVREEENYQYIPLKPNPNQFFRVTVSANETRSLDINFLLSWNEEAQYWVMSLMKPSTGEYYVDSIPLLSGKLPTYNLLKLYSYLDIGSCYIVDISGKGTGKPDNTNLGIDYVMLWGYTE